VLTVIQRVSHANVVVNNYVIGEIQQGIVALIGIEKGDTESQAQQLLDKILAYRIFADDNDKMNLSLRDINGGLLLIPQFTLAADTQKGTRPSFTASAPPNIAKPLFEYIVNYAKHSHHTVACGEFAADMNVTLCNNGPVTFTLKTKSS